ncbi:hypothetical protein [Paenibacillus alba]|uniref:Uncharacterized protein n=1 Tax=Paenibacillus alba TaxID=1197127 RepID=A0ABU6GB37_9BACL|nr:hypothetical protein [Paenibacillus alba]MEC0231151.1 hypothetical protein [Paenibacillus alba]
MKTDMTIDVTTGCFEAKVDPKTTYTPAYLKLTSGGSEIGIQATDEQLEEIAYAIQIHLKRGRVHEFPDQQLILNAESHTAVEERIA